MEAKPICLIRFFLDRFFCVYSEHTIRTLLENPCSTCAYQQEKNECLVLMGKIAKQAILNIQKQQNVPVLYMYQEDFFAWNCKLKIALTFSIYLCIYVGSRKGSQNSNSYNAMIESLKWHQKNNQTVNSLISNIQLSWMLNMKEFFGTTIIFYIYKLSSYSIISLIFC